jgi:transposase-like protein
MRIYRIVDKLGEQCKDPAQVAKELHPEWSGRLGLDGKAVKIRGEEYAFLTAVDLGTQDIVDYELARSEDYITLHLFLSRVKEKIGYNNPEQVVIDLDQAWKEAAEDVFPNALVQFCVVHFERVVDRTIPMRNRTLKQCKLKEMVRRVLYANSEDEARKALEEIMSKRKQKYFADRKSLYIIRSLKNNFSYLTTHFRVTDSFRDNNRTESVNDKIQMRLNLIRGYKKYQSARNSLNMIVMHYRFNPFESCKDYERNGKCPLNFAGVDTSRLEWIVYSQKDQRVLKAL